MRRFIIDTDTASDDAVALMAALREPAVKVELITVVAGNVPLTQAVVNAKLSVQMADTYRPPIYAGMAIPLIRELVTGEKVHGEDGMGNMFSPEPDIPTEPGHAVNAMLETVRRFSGEIELIALGPLTNVAMAIMQDPETMKGVKHLTIMGGAKMGSSSWHPVAEYNIYADADAADVVLRSGIPITLVGLDVCLDETAFTGEDIEKWNASDSEAARFCIRCNQSLLDFYIKTFGRPVITLPDPTAVVAAINESCISEQYEAYAYVETKSPACYGQLVIDKNGVAGKPRNVRVCEKLNAAAFKDYLFRLMTGERK